MSKTVDLKAFYLNDSVAPEQWHYEDDREGDRIIFEEASHLFREMKALPCLHRISLSCNGTNVAFYKPGSKMPVPIKVIEEPIGYTVMTCPRHKAHHFIWAELHEDVLERFPHQLLANIIRYHDNKNYIWVSPLLEEEKFFELRSVCSFDVELVKV